MANVDVPELVQVGCGDCQLEALWTRAPQMLLRAFCRDRGRCRATLKSWEADLARRESPEAPRARYASVSRGR
jgi:hypothetical protein